MVPLPYFKGPGTSTVPGRLEAGPWEEVSLTVNTGTVALEPRLLRTLGPLQGCGISPLSQDPLSQLLPTQKLVLGLSQTCFSDPFNWEGKFRYLQNQKQDKE